ncbi:zinc ribbon domain-containing protein [Bacillus sp. S/N-304-OC-R1]|uniref:zinc ribbon domain-containing protein n=1 Tax=Bacillus sp. S/N-304-OC-R1 TaxID=2758034 RepID=UPI001C8E9C8F|nr:zinc ribbon domain-containing protein [Bacillus sp. S/N-304-OC-R1]MBY0121530.1 zinc ribbon domain-containing protein [Bacillus sp. S/N-304-OC-R1]
MKEYKKCQSCSMPIKNVEDRGTERNQEKSLMFCKHCYQEGEYTQKNISVEDMKEFVKDKCIEMGVPKFLAGMFVRNLDKLERWK